ncbi:YdiY family protein, partial [Planctomycetota bacterium]
LDARRYRVGQVNQLEHGAVTGGGSSRHGVWTPRSITQLRHDESMVFIHRLLLIVILASTAASGADFPVKDPPEPMSDRFTWMQHKNGEWLKGEIEDLQDDTLVFESDEFDTFTLDWEDIYLLYSPTKCTCMFMDESTVEGSLRIVGEQVIVLTDQGEKHYPRSELRAIIPGELRERNFWSMKWSLGFTARRGNTEQSDLANFLFIQRRSPRARTQFDITGSYSTVDSKETTNNQNAFLRHDAFVTRKLYARIPSLQFYRDKFQNIEHRITPGAGVGYQVVNRSGLDWNVGVGGGYQFTRYNGVENDQDNSDETAVVLANTNFSMDLTKKVELGLSYNMSLGISGRRSNDHHMLLSFAFDIWKDLELDVSLTWDHIGNPQPRADGSVPKRDDLRTFVGIGWNF